MSPRSMTLREYSQFGPVSGGLCPQFRGAQGELKLIQDRQPAAAGSEQAARVGGRLGPQCLAEPAGGASHRRAAPPALGGRAQMTIGLITAAQVQRHSPAQQVGLRGLSRAERL